MHGLATRGLPARGGGAKGRRGRSLASRSANRLCATSTLSDTIVMKSSAAIRKQTVGSIARTVLRSAVPCSTSSKPITAGGRISPSGEGPSTFCAPPSSRNSTSAAGWRRQSSRPAGWRSSSPASAIRNNSSTDSAANNGMTRTRSASSTIGNESLDAANPPLACLAASAHDTASPTIAFSERWEATYSRSSLSPSLPLADEVNGGSGNHRIVLVHELCERVVQIARAAFQDGVRVADLFGQRRVVQDRHHAFAHDATEQDYRDTRPPLRGDALHPVRSCIRRRHVVDVIEQAEQAVDAIDGAVQLVRSARESSESAASGA